MKNESLLKKLASLVSDLEKIAGGYATNSRGDRFYDTKGYSAGEKDLQRMRDLAKRALGDESKMIQLAKQMAKSIKDQEKAFRRADAAKQIFSDSDARDEIVKIFMDAGVGLGSSRAAAYYPFQQLKKAPDSRNFDDLHDARTAFNFVEGNISLALDELEGIKGKIQHIKKGVSGWNFSELGDDMTEGSVGTNPKRWKSLLTEAAKETENLCEKAEAELDSLEKALKKVRGPAGGVI